MSLPSQDDTNWNVALKAHVLAGHNADGTHKVTEITEYKILTFTRDMTAASGDVATTGAGFTPRQVMFFAGVASNSAGSWGDDNGTDQMCTFQDGDGDMNFNPTSSLKLRVTASSNDEQNAAIKTLDADGFTLTWTKGGGSPTGTATIIAICFK